MASKNAASSSSQQPPCRSTSGAKAKRDQKNRRDMQAKVQRAMRGKVYGAIPKFTIDTFKVRISGNDIEVDL